MKWLIVLGVMTLATASSAQDRLICRFATTATPEAIAARHNLTLADKTAGGPFALFITRAGTDRITIQNQMRTDPQVVWVEDDDLLVMPEHHGASKGSSVAAVGDRYALYSRNTGVLSQIGWNKTVGTAPGRSVRIAILDTGLSPRYLPLYRKTVAWINAVEPGQAMYDIPKGVDSNANGIPDEGAGHGTMVAGIIDQIAPQVSFVIARVADSDGLSNAWALTKGLVFAVRSGAEVANVSLGAIERIPAISDVLDWTSQENNLLVVSAIGNNAQRMVLFPAEYSKVVCVAGLDANSRKAPFSNWRNRTISSAPATGIQSYWWDGGFGVWSGTSFASPMVAAAAAEALRRRGTGMPAAEMKRIIGLAGDNINNLNPSYSGELGTRLNLSRLLQMTIKGAPLTGK
ncbi:MAG TPA: S8 family serine peptidase [Fimbriimonadaceae bacterium]|nr:S8 family serine peptidase [Fimbriimonadaceae bacterium]